MINVCFNRETWLALGLASVGYHRHHHHGQATVFHECVLDVDVDLAVVKVFFTLRLSGSQAFSIEHH